MQASLAHSASAQSNLAALPQNSLGYVTGFAAPDHDIETRLREIGFAEGDEVEPLHYGLVRKNPMVVRLNGALIALRRKEASYILVSTEKG